jgi:hypothetical protein
MMNFASQVNQQAKEFIIYLRSKIENKIPPAKQLSQIYVIFTV